MTLLASVIVFGYNLTIELSIENCTKSPKWLESGKRSSSFIISCDTFFTINRHMPVFPFDIIILTTTMTIRKKKKRRKEKELVLETPNAMLLIIRIDHVAQFSLFCKLNAYCAKMNQSSLNCAVVYAIFTITRWFSPLRSWFARRMRFLRRNVNDKNWCTCLSVNGSECSFTLKWHLTHTHTHTKALIPFFSFYCSIVLRIYVRFLV